MGNERFRGLSVNGRLFKQRSQATNFFVATVQMRNHECVTQPNDFQRCQPSEKVDVDVDRSVEQSWQVEWFAIVGNEDQRLTSTPQTTQVRKEVFKNFFERRH